MTIGYGNDTLETLPPIKVGDVIVCPECGCRHVVGLGSPGASDVLLFYKCPMSGKQYLAGVKGKNVIGVPSDLREDREHWLCEPCWASLNRGREPQRVPGPLPVRSCCQCGGRGKHQIPVNAPPETYNCQGQGHLWDRR